MASPSLAETIRSVVDPATIRLPVYPPLATKAHEALRHDPPQPEALAELAGEDPALACTLFRAANSSFYAGLQKTTRLTEAVTRLGADKSREVLEECCREQSPGTQARLSPLYLAELWRHAHGCALGARWLATRCGFEALADQAYLAGLMHDVGKLFLLAVLDEVVRGGESQVALSETLIMEVLETLHVEQGLRLVEAWNLPDLYARAIDSHHAESLDTQDTVVALVRLANKGCHKIGLGWNPDPEQVLPTTAEAQYLGINEITLAEFEIMLEDRFLDLPAAPPKADESLDILPG